MTAGAGKQYLIILQMRRTKISARKVARRGARKGLVGKARKTATESLPGGKTVKLNTGKERRFKPGSK